MGQYLSHPVPAAVILLGLLVFFHELGHFVVGRWCGIAVETFSIGFGPRIFGFNRGGTQYQVSWIPLGGYVKFAGSHPSEEVPAGLVGNAFLKTSLPKRAATVLAGPVANFLLAITVYTVLGLDGVPHAPPLIGDVISGSAAAAAGIHYGDRVLQIGTHPITTWRDLEEAIAAAPGKTIAITVLRASGEHATLQLTPEAVKTQDFSGHPVTIGRAGIALGRQPAIVSVVAKESPAVNAGLKTGDRVLTVQVDGVARKIAFYPDLVETLREAAKKATSVVLSVTPAPLPELLEARDGPETKPADRPPEPAAAPAHAVTLDLSSASKVDSERDFMQTLGLASSELTVARGAEGDSGNLPLKTGDTLVAWGDAPLRDVFSLREKLIANNSPDVTLTVLRDFQRTDVQVSLKGVDVQRPDGPATVYTLPVLFWGQLVDPDPLIEKYDNPLRALAFGCRQTVVQTRELIGNVASLVTGDIPLKALGGPMLIAKVAGDSARRGWQTFLGSMALISINLGLLNLFPIPVLDGGQLVLMGVEAAKRRPLREAAIENFQKVGFALILALVVLATYNDLSRFWKSMLESVVGIFR